VTIEILIASDHGGTRLKSTLISHLTANGMTATDLGPKADSTSVDYPDYAAKLARLIRSNDGMGILICGSGIGMSIAVNRYEWVRAALVHDETSARLCREHNNANVIVLGERLIGELTAISCVDVFLNTGFAGGRHQRRVEKLGNPSGLLTQQEK
jgi:ribose 5-phosphate isomerase B